MGLGDLLFNAADSPIKRISKWAGLLLAFEAVAMPITFRHQLMDYVNAEAPSYERLMDSVTQTVLKDMKLPASSTQPYEVQRPTTTSTSVPTEP